MTLSAEYIYHVKKKTELLLAKLIEKHSIQGIISDTHRSRVDFNKFITSSFWKLYREKKDKLGLVYIARPVPKDIEEWLLDNFKDYMITADIYDKFCRSGFIEKSDLRTLNEIYKNNEKLL